MAKDSPFEEGERDYRGIFVDGEGEIIIRAAVMGNKKSIAIKIFTVLVVASALFSGYGVCGGNSISSKIDPLLVNMISFRKNVFIFSPILEKISDQTIVEVFIKTNDLEALKRKEIKIRTIAGDIVTASLPLSMVESIAKLSSVLYIEAASPCKPFLDVSVPEIGVDSLWSGVLGTEYRGEGVIVGIYDYGIDWANPDFIAPDGTSRILYLWDQTDTLGPHPEGFGYGTEYTQQEINDEIHGSTAGYVREKDTYGHGTHVAGIAAGNGQATGNGKPPGVYVGVAPKADLIVVKGENSGAIPNTRILDGINYIFQRAEELGKPAVVNLSLGTQRGPHDGTSLFEQGVDNLLSESGRAVVVAAGNDRSSQIHFRGDFSSNSSDTMTVEFSIGSNNPGEEDHVWFDVWYNSYTDLSLIVVTPNGRRCGPVQGGENNNYKTYKTDEGMISVTIGSYSNEDMEMAISISDSYSNGTLINKLATGTWRLLFTGHPGRFDGWLYDSSMGDSITSEVDTSTLLAEPGNAHRAITVGSYVSRREWPSLESDPYCPDPELVAGSLSESSSPGPTRDGRQKPEIAAPGEYILSSLSSDVKNPPFNYVATDSVHWAMSGTSMAAPHVTGVIALMFQADPELNVSEIRDKFIRSARKDDMTGYSLWNKDWGFGKLDGLGVVRLITSVEENKIGSPRTFSLSQNYPNPFNGTTVIEYTVPEGAGRKVSLVIYNLHGQKVRSIVQKNEGSGRFKASWDGKDENGNSIASGIYIYRLIAGNRILSRKMVLIH